MKNKNQINSRESSKFIRSSKHSLKFSNSTKLSFIKLLTYEYRRQVTIIIDHLFIHGFEESIYSANSKSGNIFNLSQEHYNLPIFFPSSFLNLFSPNSFLGASIFQCIGKHVISLINSSVQKFIFDKYLLNREINYLIKKKSNSKKLGKLQVRLANLKIIKPSTKKIPVLLNENHLDIVINNPEIFSTLDTNKETGELMYSTNSKNKTLVFNSNSILTGNRRFDLFLQLSKILNFLNPFKEKWHELLTTSNFIDGYKNYYIKIEGEKHKLLDLTPEVIYKHLRYIKIPIKSTKVFNKWNEIGHLNKSIELNIENNYVKFSFTCTNKVREEGIIVGGDQGFKNVLTLSDSNREFIQQTTGIPYSKNKFHSLESICIKLVNKKKGSNGFKRVQEHRKNFINQSINRLDFNNIKEIRYERVMNLRLNKRQKVKKMIHWSYPLIKNMIESLSKSEGFGFTVVINYYRSQRCCDCSWVQKENRKGSEFICRKCGNAMNADINAAINLSLDLHKFTDSEWNLINKLKKVKVVKGRGFYWNSDGILVDEDLFNYLDIGKYSPINP